MTSHRKIAITAALLCAVGASPAMAQENFSGAYVSAYVGGSFPPKTTGDALVFDTDQDGEFDDSVTTVGGADAFSPGSCGGVAAGAERPCTFASRDVEYGVRAGIDGRLGSMFLAGLLVEVGKTELTNSVTSFSTTPASYTVTREMDYAVSARGRLGVVAGDAALFYATGGVSYAKIDQTFATTNTANSFTEFEDDKMRFGYQAGGGVEVALTPNTALGIEYLYSKYEDDDYYVNVGPGTAPATNPFLLVDASGTNLQPNDEKFRTHSLRLTGSLRF